MRRRCPSSVRLGVGRLRRGRRGGRWRWIVNERGYANVVEFDDDGVYGAVYALPAASADEAALDAAEGVPFAYGKEYHDVDFWPCAGGDGEAEAEGEGEEEGEGREGNGVSPAKLFVDVAQVAPRRMKNRVLVYVDRLRTAEGVPAEEYVDRMNEAVKDAVALGVPQTWVDGCVRRFVPVAKGCVDGAGR